jgi:hypothetical protein
MHCVYYNYIKVQFRNNQIKPNTNNIEKKSILAIRLARNMFSIFGQGNQNLNLNFLKIYYIYQRNT